MAWEIGAHEYVSGAQTASPGAGAVALTGAAPSVRLAITITVPVGSVALTPAAPTATQALTVAPGAGALTVTGQAPALQQAYQISPGVGSVAVTGSAPSLVEVVGAQYARPISDVAAGSWMPSTEGDLYAMLDETSADDGDYISSSDPPDDDTAVLGLTSLSTPGAGTVTLRVRAKAA